MRLQLHCDAKNDSIYARLDSWFRYSNGVVQRQNDYQRNFQRFSITLFTVQHLFSASILAIRREMFWLIFIFLSGSGKCETTARRVTLQSSLRLIYVRLNRIWVK